MAVRHLSELINRKPHPQPWVDVKPNLPWDEPGFSERMLSEHLDPTHDNASRRPSVLASQIAWVTNKWLLPRGAKAILDLTCGPGLWGNELARRGYIVRGIDISPAVIAYARETAKNEKLSATYVQQDIRDAPFGSGYDCALFVYGEPNAFKWEEFTMLLLRVSEALNDKGILILEMSTPEAMASRAGTNWVAQKEGGLFSDRPYLQLSEYYYNSDEHVSCRRIYTIDLMTEHIKEYGISYQGYTNDELSLLLPACGFKVLEFFDSLTGEKYLQNPQWQVVVAEKHIGRTDGIMRKS
ncbi:MAG TPA: class I SAM-dependent methyltransferase [Firmicutes bacterium]|nr:class I SAM-dependent methyltransferase [Bacillota bacterium]